jgi:hypothetical protein
MLIGQCIPPIVQVWLQGMAPREVAPSLFASASRKNRCVKEVMRDNKWLSDLSKGLTYDMQSELLNLAHLLDDVQLDENGVNTIRSAQLLVFCACAWDLFDLNDSLLDFKEEIVHNTNIWCTCCTKHINKILVAAHLGFSVFSALAGSNATAAHMCTQEMEPSPRYHHCSPRSGSTYWNMYRS